MYIYICLSLPGLRRNDNNNTNNTFCVSYQRVDEKNHTQRHRLGPCEGEDDARRRLHRVRRLDIRVLFGEEHLTMGWCACMCVCRLVGVFKDCISGGGGGGGGGTCAHTVLMGRVGTRQRSGKKKTQNQNENEVHVGNFLLKNKTKSVLVNHKDRKPKRIRFGFRFG